MTAEQRYLYGKFAQSVKKKKILNFKLKQFKNDCVKVFYMEVCFKFVIFPETCILFPIKIYYTNEKIIFMNTDTFSSYD